MLLLRCSDPSMNFPSRLPTEKAGHFPVNEPYYPVIVNYTVRLGEVVVHEAHIRISISVWE